MQLDSIIIPLKKNSLLTCFLFALLMASCKIKTAEGKNEKLENVSYYKYLGITMSTRLSWTPAQVTLATQASKAMNVINQVNYN